VALAPGEVCGDDRRAAATGEGTDQPPEADSPESTAKEVRAVRRAGEPAGDDRAGRAGRADAPREVLSERRPASAEPEETAQEIAVREVASAKHVARVRAGGALEAHVDAERLGAMGGANAVHLGEQRLFVWRRRGGGGGGGEATNCAETAESYYNLVLNRHKVGRLTAL
jgi:hypothetical protein